MSATPHIGPYAILGELGRGGMGVVYRAKRADLDREFALKVILAGADASAEMVQRFRREAQAAATLAGQPGIVGVHDIGEADGAVYFAMDLVQGDALDAVLAEGELTQRATVELLLETAQAVAIAHARGILHRDLKPANIMVTPDGRALVTDFGLAKLQTADPELTRLTQSGEVLGTPAYMAPEQAKGEVCTPAADVYALGATMYEALAGVPPFTGDSIHAVMAQVLTKDPPPLRRVNPAVSKPLEAVVHRCLAKDPAERYRDGSALAEDLTRYLAGEPVDAVALTAGRRVGTAVRRRRLPLAIAAAVLALGAAGLGWWWSARDQIAESDQKATTTARERQHTDRATQITGAWHALSAGTGAAMQALGDHWVGHVSGIDTAGALDAVRGTAESVTAQFPDTRLPEAWVAAARGLSGDDGAWDDLQVLCAGAGDDPTPHLLAMRVALAHYARDVRPARTRFSGRALSYQGYTETPAQVEWRDRAAAALAAAAAASLWEHLQGIDSARAFGAATTHLSARRFAEAAPAFEALGDDPQFGATAQLLAGVAWFQQSHQVAAAEAWEKLIPRRWGWALHSAAMARVGSGVRAMANGTDATAVFERALGDAELAMQWAPDSPMPVRLRAVICVGWAQAMDALGRPTADTLARLHEALRSFDHAVRLQPDEPKALIQRGRARHMQGLLEERSESDPRPAYRAGLADCDTVQGRNPGESRSLVLRGEIYTDLAEWQRDHERGAAVASADAAIADLSAALEQHDDDAQVRHDRATAWRIRGQLESYARRDPVPFFERALADLQLVCASDQVARETSHLDRGHLCLQLAQARMDRRQDPRTFLRQALADLKVVLTIEPDHADALEHNAAASGMFAVVQANQRDPKASELFRTAIADFARALEQRPDDRNLRFNRIQIIAQYALFEQRHQRDAGPAWAQALEAAQLFASRAPDDGEAQLLCAQLCWQMGKRSEALEALDRAEALSVTQPRLAAPVKALRRRMAGKR